MYFTSLNGFHKTIQLASLESITFLYLLWIQFIWYSDKRQRPQLLFPKTTITCVFSMLYGFLVYFLNYINVRCKTFWYSSKHPTVLSINNYFFWKCVLVFLLKFICYSYKPHSLHECHLLKPSTISTCIGIHVSLFQF